MKKLICVFLLTALMLLCLVSCTDDPNKEEQTSAQQTTSADTSAESTAETTAPSKGFETNSDGSIDLPPVSFGN